MRMPKIAPHESNSLPISTKEFTAPQGRNFLRELETLLGPAGRFEGEEMGLALGEGTVVVAYIGGEPVGLCSYGTRAPRFFLREGVTNPKVRRVLVRAVLASVARARVEECAAGPHVALVAPLPKWGA